MPEHHLGVYVVFIDVVAHAIEGFAGVCSVEHKSSRFHHIVKEFSHFRRKLLISAAEIIGVEVDTSSIVLIDAIMLGQ